MTDKSITVATMDSDKLPEHISLESPVLLDKNNPRFVSVKQELDFLEENLCPTRSKMEHNSEGLTMDRGMRETNGLVSSSMSLDPNSIVRRIDRVHIDEIQRKETRAPSHPVTIKVNDRGQLDVVEIDEGRETIYKYLFIYEDQFSKFVVLKALQSCSITEVTNELLEVLTIIGAPCVLQSGNGRDFAEQIVRELRSLWRNVFMVHGKVVRSGEFDETRNFKDILQSWRDKNPLKKWHEGLKYVQISENTMFRHSDGKVPYDLLFGRNVHENCQKYAAEVVDRVWSEEDWNKMIGNGKGDYSSVNQTKDSRFHDGEEESHNEPVDDDVTHANDCESDSRDAEYDEESHNSSRSNNGRTAFNFVNVKSEISFGAMQAEDSQSENERSEIDRIKARQSDKYLFKCKICQKRYMKLGHLKNHIKAHTKAGKLECKICSKRFRLANLFNKHVHQFHKQSTSPDDTTFDKAERAEAEADGSLTEKRLDDKLDEDGSGRRRSTEGNDKFDKTLLRTADKNIESTESANTVTRRKSSKENRVTKANSLLECMYCQHKFDFPSVLKRHMRSHTNERPYVCQVCNKSFKQLGHLSQHSLTHTDYRSFQCAICGVKFETLDALKVHSQVHGGESTTYRPREIYRVFECDCCKKVFSTKSVLERHIFTHTHERQFGCKVCGKRFKQAGHVKSHMLVHTGERKFECTVCSKRFSLSNSLKKHMYVHSGEKPYQCDVCGARFLEKRNLNGHLMTHTNERPFSCKICGKRYTLADTLRRHISAAHEDGRTYQCEICAKMFKQLAHLSVHKKVHNDERPFQCHLCDKNFKHKNVLKSHLAIHANVRPFECDVCKATFVRKTNLQTHIASAHMNERPYACTICNKRFKQVSHLNGHVVVHSNSMPYQCDFCDRRCNRLDNLKKHMRLHTKNKE